MAENNNDQVGRLPKTPHPALRRLQPLIGRWRMEGPDVDGEVVYEWMEGDFFLIQRYDLVNYGNRYKGIDYSGWDDETGTVRSRLMGTDGSRFTSRMLSRATSSTTGSEKRTRRRSAGAPSLPTGAASTVAGRCPGAPGGGYDYRLTRID